MERLSNVIIRHKKTVVFGFAVIALACAALLFFVDVNYNLVDYLPSNAQSTTALAIMRREFKESVPNASVMVGHVSLTEALEVKRSLAAVGGVSEVLWLDDVIDLKQPLETADADTVAGFYKGKSALFSVTVQKGMEKEAVEGITALIGPDNSLTGEAPALVFVRQTAASTAGKAMAILLPIVLFILILSSASWLEPLLFLLAIGISIVINMGTNIVFGEISFMTHSISPILQLACSLDYAVFLLHSFQDNRKKYPDVEEAMRRAMRESMSTIAASAATTLFGFLALLFMNFRIGADLGLNLAKGIVMSFVSVMVFLPAVILCICKLIDRTAHRALLPSFRNVHRALSKIAAPIAVLVFLTVVPAYLGQGQTGFMYGNESLDPNTRYGRDTAAIEARFGKSNALVLLVERGDVAREHKLAAELGRLERVTGIVSYVTQVGAVIPPEYLGAAVTGTFYSDNYARMILYTDTPAEGDAAFETVERIYSIARAHYGDAFYALGQSANLYDMKRVVQQDNVVVNLIAVAAIFAVLVVTFRSATLPFILVFTIEAGIWINLAIPYFTGTAINFLGYLVLSTVQLGATVDYAILLTTTYLRNRTQMPRRAAVSAALGSSFKSLLVSALTLSTAGFALYANSTNSAIADIGLLLGRGTLLSLGMVVLVLPTLLTLFDRLIEKTTARTAFFHGHSEVNP